MTQALETLLPCPFCGSDKVGISTGMWGDEDGSFDWIECRGCGTQQRPISDDDPDGHTKALTAWNTRKPCDAGLPRTVGGDAAEPPLLSEQLAIAGADHAPGSAARDGSAGLREFDLERCHQCRKKLRSTHYITAVGVLCRACSRALSKGDATR